MPDPGKPPTHEERNASILRRTLSAVSHLYGVFSLLIGWSFLVLPATGGGIHGSRSIGRMSLVHAALFVAAGWTLWRPRKGAWLFVLAAGAGSLALAGLDFAGGRMQSIATDAMYALVAAAVFLQIRPRA